MQVFEGKQAVLHIQLLGAFSAFIDGRAIPAEQWRLKKARALVKLLALAPGHRLPRDQILETLWPEADPASSANIFYQMLHAARKLLEPAGVGYLTLEDGILRLAAGRGRGIFAGAVFPGLSKGDSLLFHADSDSRWQSGHYRRKRGEGHRFARI